MSDCLPTYLVIGAARSGTTALVEGLRTHPDVFVTQPKEPHYFALHGATPSFTGPGDDITINRVAVTDRDEYLSLYPGRHRFTALGDGSVSTLYYHERAIPEILSLAPDLRVVVMLREPVERAYSAFQYLALRGTETHTSLVDAIADEDARVAAGWHHLWHYSRMSQYADSVAAFQSALGGSRVGIWFYDDLTRDYVGTVKQVLRFIGVEPRAGEAVGVPVVNASGRPRSRLMQSSIQLATQNRFVRSSVKRATSLRMREWVRSRTLQHSDIADADRVALEPLFATDLRQLAALVPLERRPSWLRSPHTPDS
jgi:PAS domain-containing protein